jgi:carbon-monoxide dehydrogenase small subunit
VSDEQLLTFELNGAEVSAWVQPETTLLEALRVHAGATEVKHGCGEGVCGTCTVLLDGELVSSCTVLALQADARSVTTVRSLLSANDELHPLQEAFLRHGAAQCGFCTPAMLLTARRLADSERAATREQIRHAIAGNLCRCTGYTKILDAVEAYRDTVLADRAPEVSHVD